MEDTKIHNIKADEMEVQIAQGIIFTMSKREIIKIGKQFVKDLKKESMRKYKRSQK